MTIENYRIFNPIFDEDMIDKLDVELLDEDFIEQDALTYSEQLEINTTKILFLRRLWITLTNNV